MRSASRGRDLEAVFHRIPCSFPAFSQNSRISGRIARFSEEVLKFAVFSLFPRDAGRLPSGSPRTDYLRIAIWPLRGNRVSLINTYKLLIVSFVLRGSYEGNSRIHGGVDGAAEEAGNAN